MATEQEIPERFMGKFKLERSDKFDEYLASKGVSWIMRKIICFSPITKIFERSSSGEPGNYNAYNLSSKQNTSWEGWKLGESFEGMGLDGKMHKITFDLDGDTLKEHHIRLEIPQDPGEMYRYTIDDGDQLVLLLANESVTARRFFKRIQ